MSSIIALVNPMELRHLRYFVALAECLSFTRAAERVHVTQSTLSHQIRQLEEELGHPLFDRIGKRVMLTEAGETFLGYASRALREVDHGLSDLMRAGDELSGEVRIGATGTFNIGFVPECLAMFLERNPTVKVMVDELAADAIAQRLIDASLDVGIAYQPSDPTHLWFEPLYTEEMVLVVSAQAPARAAQARAHGGAAPPEPGAAAARFCHPHDAGRMFSRSAAPSRSWPRR